MEKQPIRVIPLTDGLHPVQHAESDEKTQTKGRYTAETKDPDTQQGPHMFEDWPWARCFRALTRWVSAQRDVTYENAQ